MTIDNTYNIPQGCPLLPRGLKTKASVTHGNRYSFVLVFSLLLNTEINLIPL